MNIIHNLKFPWKKIPVILLLNTILTIGMIIICCKYSVFDSFHPAPFVSGDDLGSIYTEKGHYIDCDSSELHYSGFDYLFNNKVKGHYYYTLNNGHCTFYLISRSYVNETDTPPATIDQFTGTAFLLKNDTNWKPLMTYMADSLNWNYDGMAKVTSPYIISQVDFNMPLNIFIIIITFLSIYSNIFFFILFINKQKHNIKK